MSVSSVRLKTILDMDGDFARVRTIADYRRLLDRRIEEGLIRRELPQAEPLHADIDCGWWVCHRCPGSEFGECNSGVAIHPKWQFAACLSCGRTWSTVVFPDRETLRAIDAVLRLRPSSKRAPGLLYSWWHTETVDDLIAQNRRHHWPIPEAA